MNYLKCRNLYRVVYSILILATCSLSSCTTKVSELGPVGQEYVHKDGSLKVESSHKVTLWDGHGLPNTFTIKKGHLYNNYGDKVASIRKKGDNIYIHASNPHVQSAYGGKYKKINGHFKGNEHFGW